MRVAALSTRAISAPASVGSKVLPSPFRKCLFHHGYTGLSRSARRWHSICCSIRTPAEHFGNHDNIFTYLNSLANNLQDVSTKKFEEFPWEKARTLLAERLLVLGKMALKWSIVMLFAITFLSDILMAVRGNRELVIPLGLFMGVILAGCLKEYSQEFFQNSTKDDDFAKQLLGVGSVFVAVKFLSLFFSGQRRLLLSHVGNGGLMQILWLSRAVEQTASSEMQEDPVLDTSALENSESDI